MTTKQHQWHRTLAGLKKVTDKLGKPIDEGILETVAILNLLGIRTNQSCEGHLDRAHAAPWVDVIPENEEISTMLWKKTDAMYKQVDKIEKEKGNNEDSKRILNEMHLINMQALLPSIQLYAKLLGFFDRFYTFHDNPYDVRLIMTRFGSRGGRLESAGSYLQAINEPDIKRAKLEAYQDEMRSFTEFLKKIYFNE